MYKCHLLPLLHRHGNELKSRNWASSLPELNLFAPAKGRSELQIWPEKLKFFSNKYLRFLSYFCWEDCALSEERTCINERWFVLLQGFFCLFWIGFFPVLDLSYLQSSEKSGLPGNSGFRAVLPHRDVCKNSPCAKQKLDLISRMIFQVRTSSAWGVRMHGWALLHLWWHTKNPFWASNCSPVNNTALQWWFELFIGVNRVPRMGELLLEQEPSLDLWSCSWQEWDLHSPVLDKLQKCNL